MTVASIAGVRFHTASPLFETTDTGFSDIDVDVDWVAPGKDVPGTALSAPDETWLWVEIGERRVHLPQREVGTAHRSWQLRQAAPIVAAAFERLTLHAGAIEVDGSAVAFVGATGVGKSTLVWQLTKDGTHAVADDLVPVRFGDGPVVPEPTRALPLGIVYFLDREGQRMDTAPLDGTTALDRHIANGFGEHGDPEIWQSQFDAYHRLVTALPHFTLTIPDDRRRLMEVSAFVRSAISENVG